MASPRNSSQPPRPSGSLEEDLEPGTILNERYRIDAPIGQGAMGRVYAAEHVLLRKRIAVKILRGDRALVPEIVARFEREAMAAANIEHPNIAGASDFGRLADGSVYLVLEYVQGKNLRDEIARGPMPVPRALHVARQVCSALAAAEELGIVHRDLKPENVMLIEKLGDPDFVKVLDFGIARVPMAESEDQPLTKVGIVFGTPEYMAPEQALGQRVDGRADLFALGVILFEMITGSRPYNNPKNPVLKLAQKTPRLAERVPAETLPPGIEEVVQKLLAPEAKKRFQKASIALEEIDALLGRISQGGFAAPSNAPAAAVSPAPSLAAEARMPTFLPGDPLPAFDLPSETGPIGNAEPDPPDALTLLRAPSAGAPPLVPSSIPAAPPAAPSSVSASRSSAPPAPSSVPAPPSLPARPPSSPPPAGSFAARVVALHRAACTFIDANREHLPRPLRRRVKRLPASALLAGGVGALLTVLSVVVVLIAVLRSPNTGERTHVEPAAPPPPAGEVARAPATPAVEATPVPTTAPADTADADDPRGLVALAKTRLEERNEAEALALIGRAIAAEPELADDATVVDALSRLIRSDQSSSVDAAFALLEGPMGQRGAEVVYDASLDEKAPPKVRARASAWLKTKAFDRASSPALYSAVKLRLAQSCQQKLGLLKLAENVGGKRTLEYLQELAKHTQCNAGDAKGCYACLEDAGRLSETIARIEQRLGS